MTKVPTLKLQWPPLRPDGSGITFAQRGGGTPGTNGVLHEGVTCYRCEGTGHYACDCPAEHGAGSNAATLFQHGHMLAQGESGIDPSWILLDSQSTISVFHNADMLKNIRPSGRICAPSPTEVFRNQSSLETSQTSGRFGLTLSPSPISSPCRMYARFAA